MAIEFSGNKVKRKHWLVVFMVASFLSVLVSLLLVSRVNDARSNLAQASPGALNYLLQTNRNVQAFVDALRDSRDNSDDLSKAQIFRSVYQRRFDVVWGGFTVFEINYKFQPEQQDQVAELIEYSTDFLNKNEYLMAQNYNLTVAETDSLITGAKEISKRLINVGHQYFIYASHLRDVWNEKLRRLYQLFWACLGLLLLTGVLLMTMLVRSNRRSAYLIEKSQKTQREMKRLIDELRSGKLENKAKDSFIAAASHDLRQPLHALGLFLGATEKHVENKAGREALAEAKHCTAELNRLFNSLLDLSRLDAGVVEVNKKQFRLKRLLRLMDQEFSALAKQSGVQFNVCCDLDYLHTDALLLNRILRNLLENAFTHSGATEIRIFCECTVCTVRLTVADNGSGIPAAEQAEIFSEYYQLDNPGRDRSKGLGLGLSIVKRLCEILDVRITLESDSETGTKFHLDIPIGIIDTPLTSQATEQSRPVTQALEDVLVAVIDDDANVRRGMISMLESLEFDAIAAESAVEMIRILRQRELTPDILVADYRLRDNQTGDVAIHQVRLAFDNNFPAMIITGDTSPGRMKEAAASGFELMHKPVEPEELVLYINKLLSSEVEVVT